MTCAQNLEPLRLTRKILSRRDLAVPSNCQRSNLQDRKDQRALSVTCDTHGCDREISQIRASANGENVSMLCIFLTGWPVYPSSMSAIAYYFTSMETEASAIARGLRRRDPDVLDGLIEQYQHRLLRYLVYLCGKRELAEDLFQETWIRVLERGHLYDGKREFSTWLYAVARNLTIDYLRKKSPLSLDGLMEDEEHAPMEPADPQPMAWEVMQQHEQAERVSAALVGIPAEYREELVLRFQDELALNEIATVTGAPLGTVKSRLYRGLGMLMSRLERAKA
jgi:RNA polymerase sigma-70 factor (ECF subfamily)